MVQIKKLQRLLHKHQCVGIDSNIFIYAFEQHPQFEPLCRIIFNLVSSHKVRLVTSTITVSEVLVRPYQMNNQAVINVYEQLFSTLPNFSVVNIDYPIAKLAAHLRANHALGLPDAMQIAAALSQQATVFITNDLKLKRINHVKIVCLKDYL